MSPKTSKRRQETATSTVPKKKCQERATSGATKKPRHDTSTSGGFQLENASTQHATPPIPMVRLPQQSAQNETISRQQNGGTQSAGLQDRHMLPTQPLTQNPVPRTQSSSHGSTHQTGRRSCSPVMPTGPIQSRTVQSRPTTTQNGHTAAPQVPHRRDHQDGTPPPPHHPSPPPPADGQPSHQHNDQPLPEQSESIERVLPPNLNGPQYVTLNEVFSMFSFDGLKKVFYCYDNQHHDQIWAEFQKVGSGHLRRKFKKQRDLPGIPPLHWVPEWAWNIMKTYWQSAAFKKLCDQAKQNRASMAGSVSWRGGSITSSEHEERLTLELRKVPDPDQLYCRTHGIKDKLPAGRPQEILDEYNAALKQVTDAAGDDADAIARIDRRQIWKDTIGGSKGRTLGMGNLVNLYSTDVPDSIAQQNVQLRSTVQELQAEIVATNKRFAQLEENQR
ncbi:Transposase, Ptta/En/Spm, plant [Corchorus olitorius]|uniref:Transposase, Ptta/En/Spm, plant n=1 Tax=Corchorus olitorius TaxID=93759 RepID=A0A1R3GLW9_9ROSI|nr:Transposase, Ptta/En/Spm, plant [Corchorus olitorius]